MRLLRLQTYFLLKNLLIVSSQKSTVEPSSTRNPTSTWTTSSHSTDTMYSTKKVTVEPSTTSNRYPASAWMTWPQSTNKIELTFQCSTYQPKVSLLTSSGGSLGFFEVRNFSNELFVYCKEGGTEDWYGGNIRRFPTKSWGICSSGTSETLIIERTSVVLKIMRAGFEVFSWNWGADDGRCQLEAGFWRLANFGRTVISAGSILGKVHSKL